jgi:hypothetical protein
VKYRVNDLTKDVFKKSRRMIMSSQGLEITKADYEFSGPFDYLNYHFSEFTKVDLFVVQDTEN